MRRLKGMNDTNLTFRQLAILNVLNTEPKAREQILEGIKPVYHISKATLMRDLEILIKLGVVATQGHGKATAYLSKTNQTTKPVDLEEYFREGSKTRKAGPKPFNPTVFDLLENVFTDQEVKDLEKQNITLSSKRKVLDPSIFKREIERFTVEFAWKSSRIEGNTYSLLETEVLIKQMKEAYGRTKYEATMILNHKKAVDYILENPGEFKALSTGKIINLHEILTKDLEINPGIRRNQVAITGTDFVPLNKTGELKNALDEAVKIINLTKFPLAKALLSLALISYIQPFVDGNKRTSRALSNALLIAYDFFPLSYRNLDEVEYLKAILLFYETNNLYHLKRIIVNQFKFVLDNYFQN